MRKVRLDPEQLAVQSFSVEDNRAGAEGTVHAHLATEGCQTFVFEGCGRTQFQTCAWTNLGAPCFC